MQLEAVACLSLPISSAISTACPQPPAPSPQPRTLLHPPAATLIFKVGWWLS
ncbi:unnamed protein product [Rhodiola kirilowii]